jgi:hypothetical protein
MTTESLLGQEWMTLQNNFEQAERSALAVKLLAVVVTGFAMTMGWDALLLAVLLAVLWFQEGIVRTSQARLGQRIVRLEFLIKQALTEQYAQSVHTGGAPFQLHSEWLASRQGGRGLLAEYVSHACRPTVAFPYVVLLVVVGFLTIIQ